MTTARSHPPVHTYLGDKDPMEMVDTRAGRMERSRADALLVGEQARRSKLAMTPSPKSQISRRRSANWLLDKRHSLLNAPRRRRKTHLC